MMNNSTSRCVFVLYGCLLFSTHGLLGQEEYLAKSAVLKIKDERSIASPVAGIIAASDLFEGKRVVREDLLMTIDSQVAELELAKIQQELELAKKDASADVDILYAEKTKLVAKADLDRARVANQRLPGAYPIAEMDKLVLLFEKSVAEKKKAEFQQSMKVKLIDIKKAERQIGLAKVAKHRILSPIQGEIVEVLKRTGEWVEESEIVAQVISLDELIVEVKLPVRLTIDRFANTDAFFISNQESVSKNEYPAKLHFIHPEVNPVNSTIKVWFIVRNDRKELFPGITGSVRLMMKDRDKIVETSQ